MSPYTDKCLLKRKQNFLPDENHCIDQQEITKRRPGTLEKQRREDPLKQNVGTLERQVETIRRAGGMGHCTGKPCFRIHRSMFCSTPGFSRVSGHYPSKFYLTFTECHRMDGPL
jgi:hypothetical protein